MVAARFECLINLNKNMDEILGSLIIIVSLPIMVLFFLVLFFFIKEIAIEIGDTLIRVFGYLFLQIGKLVYPLEVKKKVAKLERQLELRNLALESAKVEMGKLKKTYFYDKYYRDEHNFRLCVLALLMQHGIKNTDNQDSWYQYKISEAELLKLSELDLENIECSVLKLSRHSDTRNFNIKARVVEDNSFDKRMKKIDEEEKYLSLKDTGEKLIRRKSL